MPNLDRRLTKLERETAPAENTGLPGMWAGRTPEVLVAEWTAVLDETANDPLISEAGRVTIRGMIARCEASLRQWSGEGATGKWHIENAVGQNMREFYQFILSERDFIHAARVKESDTPLALGLGARRIGQ